MKKIVVIAVLALCLAVMVGGVAAKTDERNYVGVPPKQPVNDGIPADPEVSAAGGLSNAPVTTPFYIRFYQGGVAARS